MSKPLLFKPRIATSTAFWEDVMGVGPFFPFSDELLQLFRLLGCKVMALGSVVRNEIEFPFVGYLVANGFPVVPPDVAVISMFAEDVFVELLVGMRMMSLPP